MENRNFMALTDDELYNVNGGKEAGKVAGAVAGVCFGRFVTSGDNPGSDKQNALCQLFAYQFSGGAYGNNGTKAGSKTGSSSPSSSSDKSSSSPKRK